LQPPGKIRLENHHLVHPPRRESWRYLLLTLQGTGKDEGARREQLVGQRLGYGVVRHIENARANLRNLVANRVAEEQQLKNRHPEQNRRRPPVTHDVVELLPDKCDEPFHHAPLSDRNRNIFMCDYDFTLSFDFERLRRGGSPLCPALFIDCHLIEGRREACPYKIFAMLPIDSTTT